MGMTLRQNAEVVVGGHVTVRRADPQNAKKVVLAQTLTDYKADTNLLALVKGPLLNRRHPLIRGELG